MPKAKCPTCGNVVTYAAGYHPICPKCGFRGEAPQQPGAATAAPPFAVPLNAAPPAGSGAPTYGASAYAMPAHAAPKEQGMAIGALVCGFVGLLIAPVGLVAIILGAIALSNANREPQRYDGKGMAIAGLILGVLGVLSWSTFGFWGSDPNPWDPWDW